MKFALVDGKRWAPEPKKLGHCPQCGADVFSRCGNIRTWHWAHINELECDHWWENETAWHRTWKEQFPADWQEIVHHSDSGEKHRADVKTDQGWVIEFQYSSLNPDEFRSRNAFYGKVVWVVNGVRRKRDRRQFFNALGKGIPLEANVRVSTIALDSCALLREFANVHAPVFFDFGDESDLWLLVPNSPIVGWENVRAFSRSTFVDTFRGGAAQIKGFVEQLENINPPGSERHAPTLGPSKKRFY